MQELRRDAAECELLGDQLSTDCGALSVARLSRFLPANGDIVLDVGV